MSIPLNSTMSELYHSFFINDMATTVIFTLSLHDALPICDDLGYRARAMEVDVWIQLLAMKLVDGLGMLRIDVTETDVLRSEEHTSELQSPCNLVCRLLLEKKKKI